VLFLSAGLGFSSQAAAQSASLKIPVKISTSGAAPEETYTVTIERDPSNPNAPLPSPNQVSVTGNGATHSILEEAGIEDSDLLIAVTESDELNLLCCMVGKKAGAEHTIARVGSLTLCFPK